MAGLQPVFDAYAKAVWDKDVDGFLRLYAEDVQCFAMWADWLRVGKGPVRQATEAWFGGLGTDRVRVTFAVIRQREAGDLAWAEAFVRFAAMGVDGTELRAMDNRLTWVAARGPDALGPDGWRVVHEHTSAPLDDDAKAMFAR